MILHERFGENSNDKGKVIQDRLDFLDSSEKLLIEHDVRSLIGDIMYSKLPSLLTDRSSGPVITEAELAIAEIVPNAIVGESETLSGIADGLQATTLFESNFADVYEFREDFNENVK